MGLEQARIINLPKIGDPRGNLTFIEGQKHIPFEIKRVYYLYDVPGGESRGGHAHYKLEQLVIAASGSFDMILDDGKQKQRFHLNRSYYGLYIPKMLWREMDNFSSSSVCLVLASMMYDESDYIRNYDEFIRVVNGHG
ncbi:MAG: WxcM-like domain-containing protein [Thermaceae bacterium]|nr:WxcM-like domain-containing protein [Thermaceae bacterium]